MVTKKLMVRAGDSVTDWSDFWKLGVGPSPGAVAKRVPDQAVLWCQVEQGWEENIIIAAPNMDEAVRSLGFVQDVLETGVLVADLRGLEKQWEDKGLWDGGDKEGPESKAEADTSITKEEAKARNLKPLAETTTTRTMPMQGATSVSEMVQQLSRPTPGSTKHRAP